MEGGLLVASWCGKELQSWENVEVRRPHPISPESSQLSHDPIRFCRRNYATAPWRLKDHFPDTAPSQGCSQSESLLQPSAIPQAPDN